MKSVASILVATDLTEASDDVVQAAAAIAALTDAKLHVLATHGQGALERALVGGVASGVARSASHPVLLVPPSLWNGGT